MKTNRNLFVNFALLFMVAMFFIACGSSGGDGSDDPYIYSDYPPNYPNAKIIFVTHTIDSGDLSSWMVECQHLKGLEAADCICQQHAERWGNLSGTYKAWLSDSTTLAST